jgi:RNA polymerase sigma factor (sigma-70 family)
MLTRGLEKVLEHLGRVEGDGHRDGQLLARFLDHQDEAAFAALVHQHGPMVLGVCRRLLGNIHDAEDAFQATFLILARKAASLIKREAVASWLYAVAYRTALRAKQKASKRRAWERQVEKMPHPEVAPPEAQDWRGALDRELHQLPEKYRAAIVLCELEGKTRREAARQLGLTEGTLSSRLARGRCLLARRLAKWGLTLSGWALAAAMSEGSPARVPAVLVRATVKAAMSIAAGHAAAVATPAVALMNEVLKAMWATKLRVVVALVLAVALVGGGGLVYQAAGEDRPTVKKADDRPLSEVEILRREVEVLKLQMELLQEKVRTQGEELRSLRGHAGGARSGGGPQGDGPGRFSPGGDGQPGDVAPVNTLRPTPGQTVPAKPNTPSASPRYPVPPSGGGSAPRSTAPVPAPAHSTPAATDVRPPTPSYPVAPGGTVATPLQHAPVSDAMQEVEAALHALRQADDDKARDRAMDQLEKAMKKVRKQSRNERSGDRE